MRAPSGRASLSAMLPLKDGSLPCVGAELGYHRGGSPGWFGPRGRAWEHTRRTWPG